MSTDNVADRRGRTRLQAASSSPGGVRENGRNYVMAGLLRTDREPPTLAPLSCRCLAPVDTHRRYVSR